MSSVKRDSRERGWEEEEEEEEGDQQTGLARAKEKEGKNSYKIWLLCLLNLLPSIHHYGAY